jgi:folylpolyglutamate synthase
MRLRRAARMGSYEEAVERLYGLQSNAAVIEQWKKERLTSKSADLREETLHHMRLLGVRVGEIAQCARERSHKRKTPSEELSAIHVAGTKGKGSVCQFAESVARAHGVTTGTFVSPHLVEPRERIRLNGRPISRDLFSKYFFETAELLAAEGGVLPPFFRFLNCMAFLVFQREGVELAVVEVGVGGESD